MKAIKEALKKNKPFMDTYIKFDRTINHMIFRISPVLHSKKIYKSVMGKRLNLDNPQNFNEKLQWLKLYWQHPLISICADKYTVREYIEKCGQHEVLNDLFGVYNDSSEIDFDDFPDQFVLKCTHGCGYNIICTDKNSLDYNAIRKQLDQWMSERYSLYAGELHYDKMKPRIICEKYLDDHSGLLPTDYKIYCFNGKAEFTMICTERTEKARYDFYDNDWNKLLYDKENLVVSRTIEKPKNLARMIEAAEVLASPFPFVRMDFYNIDGKVIFGEMTFTPMGCLDTDLVEEANNYLGTLIHLPNKYMMK